MISGDGLIAILSTLGIGLATAVLNSGLQVIVDSLTSTFWFCTSVVPRFSHGLNFITLIQGGGCMFLAGHLGCPQVPLN